MRQEVKYIWRVVKWGSMRGGVRTERLAMGGSRHCVCGTACSEQPGLMPGLPKTAPHDRVAAPRTLIGCHRLPPRARSWPPAVQRAAAQGAADIRSQPQRSSRPHAPPAGGRRPSPGARLVARLVEAGQHAARGALGRHHQRAGRALRRAEGRGLVQAGLARVRARACAAGRQGLGMGFETLACAAGAGRRARARPRRARRGAREEDSRQARLGRLKAPAGARRGRRRAAPPAPRRAGRSGTAEACSRSTGAAGRGGRAAALH